MTSIDKAIQDFVISLIALMTYFGWDFSSYQNVAVAVGVALGKSAITWFIPNR